MTRSDENTPLLSQANEGQGYPSQENDEEQRRHKWHFEKFVTPEFRILVASFLVWTGFSLTQVPLLFAFRKMVCEDFYSHMSPQGEVTLDNDRCNRKEVDEGTTMQLTITGMVTIMFSFANLYMAGLQMRRWGPRRALVINMVFPVLRVSVQTAGVIIGARLGIIVFQSSQVFNIIGGPAGCTLVLNTAVAEVVAPAQRTVAFGRLQGAGLIATALGYLLGGIIGEAFVIQRPFQVTGCILALSSIYAAACVPYIDPHSMGGKDKSSSADQSKKKTSLLGILAPQRLRLQDGRLIKHYGALILALGIFTGVLASGYAPILIQLYAVGDFHFTPSQNSILMSVNSLIRGFFLILIFPLIIKHGRRWFSSIKDRNPPEEPLMGDIPTDIEPTAIIETEPEPTNPPPPVDEDFGAAFDLFFLRWSMLLDAIITGCIAFTTQAWHIYLAGFLLPFASGSAPASKGVLTEICPASQRAEALQAMTMVEYLASIITMGCFGFVFYAFVSIDKAYLTFLCNAAVALVAIFILLFASLAPKNSHIESAEEAESESGRTLVAS